MLCQPPSPKRGRESEEGLSVSEEVTFDATNDPSVSELEDLRVEDENEVGTSETALDTIPGGCSLKLAMAQSTWS